MIIAHRLRAGREPAGIASPGGGTARSGRRALAALGILVVQMIRLRAFQLYPSTLVVRTIILVGLLIFFVVYRDPMMMVLLAIVGIGFALTLTCLLLDRRSVYDDIDLMDGGL